jgi:nitric oxide reductase subunit C
VQKIIVFLSLFTLFILFSLLVYTSGTATSTVVMNQQAINGKMLYQKYNCSACHQIYGLGGYLGPELTTVISLRKHDEGYSRSIMQHGSQRMPNFHLSATEINEMMEFLKYVDTTALTYKKNQYQNGNN